MSFAGKVKNSFISHIRSVFVKGGVDRFAQVFWPAPATVVCFFRTVDIRSTIAAGGLAGKIKRVAIARQISMVLIMIKLMDLHFAGLLNRATIHRYFVELAIFKGEQFFLIRTDGHDSLMIVI